MTCHDAEGFSSNIITRSEDLSPSLTSAAASMIGGMMAVVVVFGLHREEFEF